MPIGASTSPRVHSGLEYARVFRQLGFEAHLGAGAVPRDDDQSQIENDSGSPAEEPDDDDTVIEDGEQRRGRSVKLDDTDDRSVRLIAHRRIDLFQTRETAEGRVMPFRSRLTNLRDRLAAQCSGHFRVLAEMAVR